MRRQRTLSTLAALAAALLLAGTALAAAIDPVARTVATGTLFVDFNDTNPEHIEDIRWNGSGNLTNSAVVPACPDALEYFGNSWVSENEGTPSAVFVSLVGWGTTGTWTSPNHKRVNIGSASAGCFGSANLPITTSYQFWDHGAPANRLGVKRTFAFGAAAFAHDVRPYIPRQYPMTAYTQVLHPDAAGASLLTQDSTVCDFGCRVDDWNDTWYAIHNPTTGAGLIVRREPSAYDAALWVDQDGGFDGEGNVVGSFTNASSVLLLQPAGGFTGTVTEQLFLCFYDSSTWTPSLALPPGC